MKNYFRKPKQIRFCLINDNDNEEIELGGIAYEDFIICGCCGGAIPIDCTKILEVYDNWVSLSNKIMGI